MGLFFNKNLQPVNQPVATPNLTGYHPSAPTPPPPVDNKTLQKYHDFVNSTKQNERDLFFSHLNSLAQKGDTRSKYLLDNLKPLTKGKGTNYNTSLAGKASAVAGKIGDLGHSLATGTIDSGSASDASGHAADPIYHNGQWLDRETGKPISNTPGKVKNNYNELPHINKGDVVIDAVTSKIGLKGGGKAIMGLVRGAGKTAADDAAKVAGKTGVKSVLKAGNQVGVLGAGYAGADSLRSQNRAGKSATEIAKNTAINTAAGYGGGFVLGAGGKILSEAARLSQRGAKVPQSKPEDTVLRLNAPTETAAPKGLPAAGTSSAAPKRTPGGAVMVDSSSKEAQILQNAGKSAKIAPNPTKGGQNLTDLTAPKVTQDQMTAAGRKVADGNLIQGSSTAPAPKKDLGSLMQRWSDLRSGKVENTSRIGHINTLNDVIEHPHASQAVKDQAMAERDTLMGRNMQDKLATEHSLETGQPVASAHETLQAGHGPRGAIYQDVQSMIDDRAGQAGKRIPHDYVDEAAQPEPAPSEGSPAAQGKSKDLNWFHRNARTGEGLLRSMGDAGKKLAGLMDDQRAEGNAISNRYHEQIPSVLKLKGDDMHNFWDAVEKNAAPANDHVAQAVKEWRGLREQIIKDANTHGREVHDLGETYLPHDYSEHFKNDHSFQAAAEQLVKGGDAKNLGEASRMLKQMQLARQKGVKFGNFDKERTNNSLKYKRDISVIHDYLNGAAKAISHDQHYGAKYEKAEALLDQIGIDGHDLSRARDIFDWHVGNKQLGANQALEGVRAFESGTKLGRAAISNLTQSNNTQTMAGVIRWARHIPDSIKVSKDDAGYLRDVGETGSSAIEQVRAQQGGLKGRAASLTMPFFNKVETFNRTNAALVGRDFADHLAKKGDTKSMTYLRDVLGVKGDIGKTLTREQQIQASRAVVKHTQFLVGSKDLPHWMTDNQYGKTASQFRSFSYKQQQFIFDQVLRPAAPKRYGGDNNYAPIARYIAGSALMGTAAYKVRASINNTNTKENSETTNIANIIQAAGGFGITGDALQNFLESSSYDHPGTAEKTLIALSALTGGPAGSDLAGAVAAGQKARDGSTYGKLNAEKFAAQHIPVVGPRVAKTSLFDKTKVAINQNTFDSMSGNDKINYLLKTSDKNRERLLSQTNDKGVSVKDRIIKELLTDKKSVNAMQSLTADQKKQGAKPVTPAQMKEALSKMGVKESDYSGQLDKIKKAASDASKAAYKTRKNTPKWKSPLLH